jgi:hypothetical protein
LTRVVSRQEYVIFDAKEKTMSERTRFLTSAVVAALLFSIGYAIVLIVPGGGTVAEDDFLSFYVRDRSFATIFLLLLAMLAGSWALVWFFSEVRARLGDSVLARTAWGASIAGATALAIGAALLFAPSGVQMNGEADFVGVPVAHTFAQAGLGVMLGVGMYSLAVAIALFSVAFQRAHLVPNWLAVGGLVIAVLLLGSYIWAPGYLLPVWIVLIGAIGLRERQAVETSTHRASMQSAS